MFQDNYCGVYAITLVSSGLQYIGSAQNMVSRQARHIKDLVAGRHHNRHLQAAFDQHGAGDLIFSVVQICGDRDSAYQLEAEILATHEGLLNVGKGVRGGDNLTRNPDRTRILADIRIGSAAALARLSIEQRRTLYGKVGELNGMHGRHHSGPAKQAMSRFKTGNQYAKGAIRSADQRAAMSALASQRTGEANPFYGRQHTPETKAKIAATKAKLPRVLPSNSKEIVIEGVVYLCIRDAMKATGLSRFVIKRRLADPAFTSYQETK